MKAAWPSPQFFDPPANNPPEDGGWTLPPGKEGRARPPIAVDFQGTVIHEKPDPLKTLAENKKRQAELEDIKQKNAATLERAVFILSQSTTGRHLLQELTAEGYRIVFDDRRTGERGAGGLCDPADKMIILRAHTNAEYIALLLGHEGTHALQNTKHDLFPSSRHKPEEAIKLSFAIEADAYAHQAQIALELAQGDPEGPADQVRFQEPLSQMRQRFPDVLKAAEKALQKNDDLKNGAVMAAAFQAFYDNFYLRTFYEDAHMEWVNTYAPRMKGSFPWLQRHFTKDADAGWIKDKIRHQGIPYLKAHAPSLDFDDARHAGVTVETEKKIHKFYKDFLPKEEAPSLRRFGLHMKDAIAWVLGHASGAHAVVFKGKDPGDKPPLRPPPRKKWGRWK